MRLRMNTISASKALRTETRIDSSALNSYGSPPFVFKLCCRMVTGWVSYLYGSTRGGRRDLRADLQVIEED